MNRFYAIFFFLLTANTLLPIPIDKLCLFLCVLYILFLKHDKDRAFLDSNYIAICLSILSVAVIGAIINTSFDPMLYYPIVGVMFVSFYRKEPNLQSNLYYGLLIHIILGVLLYFTSYLYLHPFVRNMAEKGAPFLHASLGFASTNQTFGTYCILWFIIYFDRKRAKQLISRWHRVFYIIVLIAIISTFNRSSYIFFLLIVFFRNRRLALSIVLGLVILVTVFFNEFKTFILNADTLDSRNDLLQGFRKSYLQSNSLLVYIFGRGAVFVTDQIAMGTTWSDRKDIENGYAFILHGYGIIGLILYVLIGLFNMLSLFFNKRRFESIVLCFYMFFSLYFTQELVTNAFYLFLAYILRKHSPKIKKGYNANKAQSDLQCYGN